MEKIGQTLAKQLRQSRTDLNKLTQAILADKEIADFITSNGLTQEQINRSSLSLISLWLNARVSKSRCFICGKRL